MPLLLAITAVRRSRMPMVGFGAFRLTACALMAAWTAASGAVISRPITVWMMPSEEAEARATSDVLKVAEEIRAFNRQLLDAGGRVRVLNTLPPRDAQLIVFNSAFAVPNWAWVKNQTETIRALQRFANTNDVRIDVLFQTWDRAFADLSVPAGRAGEATPDLVQIGSTWAAYFASRQLVMPRPGYVTRKGAWEDVAGRPACVLPYVNDVRLVFSWSRLPTQDKTDPAVTLNTSSWPALLDSLRQQGGPGDRIAFAGGLTLNLIMDYSMLVWAGGVDPIISSWWGTHADLTSQRALQTPELLARAAGGADSRRLIVVPESSHQALTQAFVAGEYRATIEPANFVSRWKKDFDKTFGGKKRFWDYASASAPPQPLLGGSYLAVMPSPDLSVKAFELGEFLTQDEEYTTVLARNGHLPSQRPGYGMEILLSWLGGSEANEATLFTEAVQQASIRGKRLPDLAEWPTEIESTEILEAFQRIWRRIGDGNVEGLRSEAAAAENALNLKINRVTQLRATAARYWWLAILASAAALAAVLIALVGTRRALRREESAFEQVRKLRGFSANALIALARYHTFGIYSDVADGMPEAKKRSIIAAGLQGWRRGRNPDNWRELPAHEVVWRSVLLAFDLVHEPDLYEQWEQSGSLQTPREFLEAHGHLRRSFGWDSGDTSRSYFVQVSGPGEEPVALPFLMEQALACLFQNALQASDRECQQKGPRKPIMVAISSEGVTIVNAGEPIPEEIRRLVNDNPKPEDFESAVLKSVRTSGGRRPGIGLTEAFAIATQSYGGIEIGADGPSVTIRFARPASRRRGTNA